MKLKQILLIFTVGYLGLASSLLVAEELPISGTLLPNLSTKIASLVTGRVQEIFVGTGDLVEKGQILAKVDPLTFELDVKKCKNDVELARLAYDDAKTHFFRMQKLWEKEDKGSAAIPQTQYDAARSHLTQTQLLLEQAELNLEQMQQRLDETEIKAPYKGVITGRLIDPGELVSEMGGKPLFEIMDTSRLVFEFALSQSLLGRVKQGQKVSSEYFKTEVVVTSIFPQVDEANRCLKCRVVVPNEDLYLKPGLFVTAKIQLDQGE